jgi:hypothetical protein
MGFLIVVPVLVRIALLVESMFGVMVFLLSYLIPLRRPLGCERLS